LQVQSLEFPFEIGCLFRKLFETRSNQFLDGQKMRLNELWFRSYDFYGLGFLGSKLWFWNTWLHKKCLQETEFHCKLKQYNVSSTQNTQVTTTFNYIDINKQKIVWIFEGVWIQHKWKNERGKTTFNL